MLHVFEQNSLTKLKKSNRKIKFDIVFGEKKFNKTEKKNNGKDDCYMFWKEIWLKKVNMIKQ